MSTCKWKQCKKVAKNESEGGVLLLCSNTPKCENKIHQVCLTDLLAHFGDSEGVSTAVCGKRCFNAVSEGVTTAVCGKRCFNAVKKAVKEADNPQQVVKKRVAWHNEGPTPSISSVSCLIDWMTTGYNYSRYRGGESQNGETKATIAGEVLRFIASCGVTTSRTAKDIQTKIASLEQSFKSAQDWLCATGQGVEDEKCLREAITMLCPYYYNLYDIRMDRDSTSPLMLNTDNIDSNNESIDDDDSSSETSETDNTIASVG
ncbi:hypothetical protein PHMEG_0003358 [Phytophthora megakarya]|uniref:Uncharacterized protein n=1 Tax=Phytophthora megakarya TaxID=4795 RepID=A0A225WWL6_9STRA|nr:hypothetical protein PHMEG_0003358 [Phytophthora megakarya]